MSILGGMAYTDIQDHLKSRDKETVTHVQGKQEVMSMSRGREMVLLLCLSEQRGWFIVGM